MNLLSLLLEPGWSRCCEKYQCNDVIKWYHANNLPELDGSFTESRVIYGKHTIHYLWEDFDTYKLQIDFTEIHAASVYLEGNIDHNVIGYILCVYYIPLTVQ